MVRLQSRSAWPAPERSPDLADRVAEGLSGIVGQIESPQHPRELDDGHHAALVLHERCKQVELTSDDRHRRRVVTDEHRARGGVDGDVAAGEHAPGLGLVLRETAAQGRPDPCQEHFAVVGLEYVVVGPAVERLDDPRFAIVGGENDSRAAVAEPDVTIQLETIQVGQAEIDQRQIRHLGIEDGEGFGGRARNRDTVPAGGEDVGERPTLGRVIFDDQNRRKASRPGR